MQPTSATILTKTAEVSKRYIASRVTPDELATWDLEPQYNARRIFILLESLTVNDQAVVSVWSVFKFNGTTKEIELSRDTLIKGTLEEIEILDLLGDSEQIKIVVENITLLPGSGGVTITARLHAITR